MTDYAELVKTLRWYMNDDTDELRNQAADAIEELTAELEYTKRQYDLAVEDLEKIGWGEWIPVTERLPKYGDWVLGIGTKKGYHVCEYRGITHFPYSGNIPWFSAKGRSVNITHWMPLPIPPKEETE